MHQQSAGIGPQAVPAAEVAGAVAVVGHGDEARVADVAADDSVVHAFEERDVPQHEAGHEPAGTAPGGSADAVAVGDGGCNGLFADDVLAGLESRAGEVGVGGVGRGDDDRVHFRVVENDRRVGVGAFDFEVGCSELESARVHITERHDVGLVSEVLAQAAAVGSKPAAAGADNSEAQAVVAH